MSEITLKLSETRQMLLDIIKYNNELADRRERGASLGWEERIVPYLVSQPGVGKTSITMQAAADSGSNFLGFIPAQYDPSELAGFMFFDSQERVSWRAVPNFLKKEGPWVILADEFGQATPMQKNIMAQLIQEGRLDQHVLSPKATVVLAGNRQTDRAAVNPDPTHVLDRVMIINVTASIEDWKKWALTNGIRPEIIGFLHFQEKYFSQFNPQQRKNVTPRGWAKVSTILNMKVASQVQELAMIAGQIGDGPATHFHGYLRVYRDLPDIDKIIADPANHPVPSSDRPEVLYALASALADKVTVKNVEAVLTYVRRMPTEFGFMSVTDAITRDDRLKTTRPMVQYLSKEGKAIMFSN